MRVGMNIMNTAAAPADPETAKDGPATATQASGSPPPRSPMQKVLPGALLVPIDRVERDPAQPRRDWTHGAGRQRLEELTQSVREFGLLQPLLVRQVGERYVVIAGGRRLVAARRAGLTEVPVVVRHAESATVRILQLLENLQRQELSPTDEARAYQELMDRRASRRPRLPCVSAGTISTCGTACACCATSCPATRSIRGSSPQRWPARSTSSPM